MIIFWYNVRVKKRGDFMHKLTLYKGEEVVLNQKIKVDKNNNLLKFNLEDCITTIDLESKLFTRENEEYIFLLDIQKEKCEIKLKKEDYLLQVNVEYAILLKNQNELKLNYLIETDDNPMSLVIRKDE